MSISNETASVSELNIDFGQQTEREREIESGNNSNSEACSCMCTMKGNSSIADVKRHMVTDTGRHIPPDGVLYRRSRYDSSAGDVCCGEVIDCFRKLRSSVRGDFACGVAYTSHLTTE